MNAVRRQSKAHNIICMAQTSSLISCESVPRDVWRHIIFPNLNCADRFLLNHTSKFFNSLISTTIKKLPWNSKALRSNTKGEAKKAAREWIMRNYYQHFAITRHFIEEAAVGKFITAILICYSLEKCSWRPCAVKLGSIEEVCLFCKLAHSRSS